MHALLLGKPGSNSGIVTETLPGIVPRQTPGVILRPVDDYRPYQPLTTRSIIATIQRPANAEPGRRHLILLGAGHSHLVAIRQFARHPPPGVAITLISQRQHAVYSGMVPGLIAGHYTGDEALIDLRRLCRTTGIALLEIAVDAIDTEQQQLYCRDGTRLHYDWLSLNCGATPDLDMIPGAAHQGIPAQPVDRLQERVDALEQYWLAQQTAPRRIAVVGGGAAGIEVALALRYRLLGTLGPAADHIEWPLLTAAPQLLPDHNRLVRRYVEHNLRTRGVTVHRNTRVQSVYRDKQSGGEPDIVLQTNTAGARHCDTVIWAVGANSHPWLGQTRLTTTDRGLVRVNAYLQSVSHSNVFAAGDVAHFDPHPLPQSGVYAVRQGATLAANLARYIAGEPLHAFRPQHRTLSIISLGERKAIASRGAFCLWGHPVWRWKDAIDRRFVRQFQG